MLSKEHKKEIRKRMSLLMGEDESWDKDPVKAAEIRKLSKLLSSDLIADKKPLPKMEADKLTVDEYNRLLEHDYQVNDIRKALGLSRGLFQKWREQKGISTNKNGKQTQEEKTNMKFNLNTATLLIPSTFGFEGKECLSISKSGLALSGPIVQRLGKPEWIRLYIDEQNKAVFVFPCKATDEGARGCVNPKRKPKAGYRRNWTGRILEKVASVGNLDHKNHRYSVSPEIVEGHSGALGFDLAKAVKEA